MTNYETKLFILYDPVQGRVGIIPTEKSEI